jgi:hypothetical protein
MAVNQQNVSVVRDFVTVLPNGGLGSTSQYAGPAGVMPGGATFMAVVMCRVRSVSAALFQVLFANFDVPNFRGFSIGVAEAAPGHVLLSAALGDGVASQLLAVDLGPGPLNKLMVIALATDGTVADGYRLYVNGALVAQATLLVPAAPSALQPRVGAANAAGTDSAPGCDIAGVAFLAQTPLGIVPDAIAGQHFDSCHRAMAMGRLNQLLGSTDFTNRFDVRDGAVVAGRQGTIVNGDLITLPGAAATWAPSAGASSLTRLGPDPVASVLGGVRANVITNPVWAYTL